MKMFGSLFKTSVKDTEPEMYINVYKFRNSAGIVNRAGEIKSSIEQCENQVVENLLPIGIYKLVKVK